MPPGVSDCRDKVYVFLKRRTRQAGEALADRDGGAIPLPGSRVVRTDLIQESRVRTQSAARVARLGKARQALML